jgi:succinyl-CoA synthetase beta subunit
LPFPVTEYSFNQHQRRHQQVAISNQPEPMYTREQAKEIVDKVLNMATADAVEVNLTGGERSGTRWANSSITTNLVQYDRQVTVTVRL